ncbi:MAG: hypothetical protein IJP46_05615 [Prevotella sp.]|nr:hypothetical protein [Prevotella sp.]
MNNEKELRLTDIVRYIDVEEGRLVFCYGEHKKSCKAIWLSDLRIHNNKEGSLPRETLPVRYRNYGQWIDCPRIKLNTRNFMWIEPLNCCSWVDMGVNLYLCSSNGWPEPLPRHEYVNLVNAFLGYGISEITVDEPTTIVKDSRFHPDNVMGLDRFWD